jgi:glycosyltransferase involved in cell wall biosynthesis
MRICLVSHEYPPETGGGGIGTYLLQIGSLLCSAGHAVEVFAGTAGPDTTTVTAGGPVLHRVSAADSPGFRVSVLPAFAAAHSARPFDVVEGTDFDASALEIKRRFPGLPCVVKLHTPRFLIDEMHSRLPTTAQRIRILAGALRRGRFPREVPIRSRPEAQAEIAAVAEADEIAAPSRAIGAAATTWATLDPARISVFPYPYVPSPELLAIPAGTSTNRITFIGRIELRKGVIDLADAIAEVHRSSPGVRFRFVGREMPSPVAGVGMRAFLERRLVGLHNLVEFTGPVPPEELARILSETDVVAAPSHWESFGLVCCEALAAARGVVASANGGMAEILVGGRCGILVPPRQPGSLAAALIRLLKTPALRQTLGEAGRRHVLEAYGAETVLAAQIASYRRAIARCPA